MSTEHADHTCGEHECMICHEKCENHRVKRFKCDHTHYHLKCIGDWLMVGRTCPYCRAPRNTSKVYKYDSSNIFNRIEEKTINPNIYIWHSNQTIAVNSYREIWNFNGEVKVIDRNHILDLYKNDIVYNHN